MQLLMTVTPLPAKRRAFYRRLPGSSVCNCNRTCPGRRSLSICGKTTTIEKILQLNIAWYLRPASAASLSRARKLIATQNGRNEFIGPSLPFISGVRRRPIPTPNGPANPSYGEGSDFAVQHINVICDAIGPLQFADCLPSLATQHPPTELINHGGLKVSKTCVHSPARQFSNTTRMRAPKTDGVLMAHPFNEEEYG